MVRKVQDEGSENGLFLRGVVVARFRRVIRAADRETEIVVYRVLAGHNVYDYDEYSPEGYRPIGSYIEVPVVPVLIRTRRGQELVRLRRARPADLIGDSNGHH